MSGHEVYNKFIKHHYFKFDADASGVVITLTVHDKELPLPTIIRDSNAVHAG